jgi:hypothetical protein
MIDTLHFICGASLRPGADQVLDPREGWQYHTIENQLPNVHSSPGWQIRNRKIGLSLRTFGCGDVKVEASLPKLIYGHNGLLITPDNWELAWKWLDWFLQNLLVAHGPSQELIPVGGMNARFTRVDLCWQFPRSAGLSLLTAGMRHACIRSGITSYNLGQTHMLRGSLLTIVRYDKTAQMHSELQKTCPVDRLEMRISEKGLKERYPTPIGTGLSEDWCRRMIRTILADEASSIPIPQPQKIVGFLVWLQKCAPQLPIMGAYVAATGASARTQRRLRRAMDASRPDQLQSVSLLDYFPEANWPPVINVPSSEKEIATWEWLRRQVDRFSQPVRSRA